MLDDGTLKEANRDKRGRILITAASVDAAAVAMGRKVVAREEVAEIAPALNAASEASLTAITSLTDLVREQNQRIYELQQRVIELEVERRYLLTSDQVANKDAEIARLRAEVERLTGAQVDTAQTPAAEASQQNSGSWRGKIKRLLGNG